MGVRGLQSFLKQRYSTSKSIEDLLLPKNAKLRIGIDISYYVYRWQGSSEKILQLISLLESNKHRVILCFDGIFHKKNDIHLKRVHRIISERGGVLHVRHDMLSRMRFMITRCRW